MKPLYLLKNTIIGCLLIYTTAANAQMVGSDVFLKGAYVEVGIGNLGYYGSGGSAPTGYHPRPNYGMTTGQLGFVADPLMTGWSSSTSSSTSHYMGDYFVPGSPFEGWELQVDGKRCQAYNSGGSSTFSYSGGMGTCTGANTAYAATGSQVIGTWEGMIDSIDVKQITTLDTNDHYFTVKVVLTNLAVAPKNNIYYFRSVDPDNDEPWPGGGFPTDNIITHQMPGDPANYTAVTATGLSTSSAFLALGTADTNSRAMIYNSWGLTVALDLADVYGGLYGGGTTAFYNVGVNHPGDIGIGLTMYIPHIATVDSAGDSVLRVTSGSTLHPANTATFTYFWAFSQAGVDSAIARAHSTPTSTLGIRNMHNSADINVYPNPSHEAVSVTGLATTDHVLLYDMMGRELGQGWQVTNEGTNTFRYNNLSTGAYILVVTDAGRTVKTRVPIRKL